MLDESQSEMHDANHTEQSDTATESQKTSPETTPEAPETAHEEDIDGHWRTEAGRKGARRVHQLIRLGRLYEQEHGLKGGRQRLRQLIGEGKLYELEHGLHVVQGRESRMPRLSSRQALTVLLESLSQLVKPIHRANVQKLLDVLREEEEK